LAQRWLRDSIACNAAGINAPVSRMRSNAAANRAYTPRRAHLSFSAPPSRARTGWRRAQLTRAGAAARRERRTSLSFAWVRIISHAHLCQLLPQTAMEGQPDRLPSICIATRSCDGDGRQSWPRLPHHLLNNLLSSLPPHGGLTLSQLLGSL